MSNEIPAWVPRLTKEQASLQRLTAQMDYVVTSPDDQNAGTVIPLLEEISARCRALKEYEENEAFLPSLAAQRPDLKDAIRRLPMGHTSLDSDVRDLLAAVLRQPLPENLHQETAGRIRQWLVRIAEHLRHVKSVIEQAFPETG
jgi:hypothetical protein